ncbi:MAG: SdiA-regulated domain-containing protein [Bacteroidota bacterium]
MKLPGILMLCTLFLSPFVHAGDPVSWLSRYDLSTPAKKFTLHDNVSEASGLATTPDGRLLTHDDEKGVVYQVDYTNGKIIKRFSIGSAFLEEDFEGIAVKKDTVFLVASNGNIFEFREGQNGDKKKFQLYRTTLSTKNDIEGLEYDPISDCLLLVCKGAPGKGHGDNKAIYAFSLKTKKLEDKPRMLVSVKEMEKAGVPKNFNPSGIALHPASGTFFIISADAGAVIEVDRTGKLLAHAKFPRKPNRHPEGIAFAPDLSMLICNDGQGGDGTLTVYGVKK